MMAKEMEEMMEEQKTIYFLRMVVIIMGKVMD